MASPKKANHTAESQLKDFPEQAAGAGQKSILVSIRASSRKSFAVIRWYL
jgi:hypothetical protein